MDDVRQFRPGMQVVATDGPLGEVDALQTGVSSSPGNSGDLFVLGTDGVVRIALAGDIDRVDDDTIYLRVPGSSLVALAHNSVTSASGERRHVGTSEGLTIPLVEERLDVGTRVVELGVARVHKHVEERIEEQVVPLEFEEIEIERVPVDEVVDSYPASYVDGDVLVVPLVEEEIVEVIVRRQLRMTEQVRIRRVIRQRQETIETALRREDVEVDEVWHESAQPPTTADPLDGDGGAVDRS